MSAPVAGPLSSSAGSFKPFCLGFLACAGAMSLLASGPRLMQADQPTQPGTAAAMPEAKAPAPAQPEEGDIKLEDIPQPVLAAVQETAGEIKIKSAYVEEFDGVRIFSVHGVDADNAKLTIMVTAGGTVLQIDEQADEDDLPKDFIEAILKQLPGGKIAEASVQHSETFFALVEKDGKHYAATYDSRDGLTIDEADDGQGAENPKAPGF